MATKLEQVLTLIEGMTILELKDLNDQIKRSSAWRQWPSGRRRGRRPAAGEAARRLQ
jgi:hypothetical protein